MVRKFERKELKTCFHSSLLRNFNLTKLPTMSSAVSPEKRDGTVLQESILVGCFLAKCGNTPELPPKKEKYLLKFYILYTQTNLTSPPETTKKTTPTHFLKHPAPKETTNIIEFPQLFFRCLKKRTSTHTQHRYSKDEVLFKRIRRK